VNYDHGFEYNICACFYLEIMQGVDIRDNATQQAGAVRYDNYTQFLRGVEGLRGLRLGVVRNGEFECILGYYLRK
jgi:hypothetical protein